MDGEGALGRLLLAASAPIDLANMMVVVIVIVNIIIIMIFIIILFITWMSRRAMSAISAPLSKSVKKWSQLGIRIS